MGNKQDIVISSLTKRVTSVSMRNVDTTDAYVFCALPKRPLDRTTKSPRDIHLLWNMSREMLTVKVGSDCREHLFAD